MDIEIERHPDAEGNFNRGFRVDALTARVGGERVGYLVLIHIPLARVFDWHGEDAGMAALRYAAASSGTDMENFLRNAPSAGQPPTVGRSALRRALDREGPLGRLHGWAGNIAFHVDRPMVDFARMADGEVTLPDYPRPRFVGVRRAPIQAARGAARASWQGRGLGRLLYLEGSRWMAERGMLLHASRLRSAAAERLWEGLARDFPEAVRHVPLPGTPGEPRPSRTALDGRLLPPTWIPGWAAFLRVTEAPAGLPERLDNLWDLESDVRDSFELRYAEARAAGREPLGGEEEPSRPSDVLEWWRARRPSLMSASRGLHGHTGRG